MNALVKHLQDIGQPCARATAMSNIAANALESASSEQAAYERGLEEALCRASVTIEQALLAASASLASVRAQWTTECQERICREAAAGRALIENRLSADLLDVLSPFVEASQRERIRRSFLQRLQEHMATMAEVSVKLIGPADEGTIMVDCLGKMGITAIFHERDQPVMDAKVGSKVLRADFGSWSREWFAEFGDSVDVPA